MTIILNYKFKEKNNMNLSYVGNVSGFIEYLKFCKWAEMDAIRKGAKVVKIFSDMSGYVAE